MRQLPPSPASFFNFLLWCIFGALNILCFCDCNHTIGNISMSQLQTKVQETVNREQLLSYSGEHLHLIILISVPEEIDWLSFFPGNSMRFGRIERREKARKTKAGQKHSENISSLCGCETKNTVASLLSQSFQSLAIMSRALSRYWSKSYTLEIIWFSLTCGCSVHITSE